MGMRGAVGASIPKFSSVNLEQAMIKTRRNPPPRASAPSSFRPAHCGRNT